MISLLLWHVVMKLFFTMNSFIHVTYLIRTYEKQKRGVLRASNYTGLKGGGGVLRWYYYTSRGMLWYGVAIHHSRWQRKTHNWIVGHYHVAERRRKLKKQRTSWWWEIKFHLEQPKCKKKGGVVKLAWHLLGRK